MTRLSSPGALCQVPARRLNPRRVGALSVVRIAAYVASMLHGAADKKAPPKRGLVLRVNLPPMIGGIPTLCVLCQNGKGRPGGRLFLTVIGNGTRDAKHGETRQEFGQ